jgi:hypothetical protein
LPTLIIILLTIVLSSLGRADVATCAHQTYRGAGLPPCSEPVAG